MNSFFVNYLRNYYKDEKIIGAEIGVNTGTLSRDLCRNLNIETLYLVDNYSESFLYGNKDERLKKFYKTMKKHRDVYVQILKDSSSAKKSMISEQKIQSCCYHGK